jgi:hypothetical protein
VFTLADSGSNNRYVIPAKSADKSTVRLLLDNNEQESLTVYTDGLRAYEPLDDDGTFDRKYVIHSDGEYADEDVHINTCESHGSLLRPWIVPSWGLRGQADAVFESLSTPIQLYRKPGDEAFKHAVDAAL